MDSKSPNLTELLVRAQRGDRNAAEQAFPEIYGELRRIAAGHFRKEPSPHLLQPTALVHEAWLKFSRAPGINIESRVHFLAISSRFMRQVLIDQARHRKMEAVESSPSQLFDTSELDEALTELEKLNPRQCQVVEMRYFAGMSIEEIAAALELTPRTIRRDWAAARAWLFQYLTGESV